MRSICLLTFFCLTFFVPSWSQAQQGSIQGTVYDEAAHQPVPGVYIVFESTNKGTITDERVVYPVFSICAPSKFQRDRSTPAWA